MKKANLIRKKVLWVHSRLEQELGIEFEVERVKPRLYQFTYRGNGICLGYTRLQVGLFLGEDSPFAESSGFFLSREVGLVKNLLRCEYELEFPHRDILRVEKTIRKWKKELEQMIREIKQRVIVGGVGNVFGKGKAKPSQGMGKRNRHGNGKPASKGTPPKRQGGKDIRGSKIPKSGGPRNKQQKRNDHSPVHRPVKTKGGKRK
jgi:hypothetical protein